MVTTLINLGLVMSWLLIERVLSRMWMDPKYILFSSHCLQCITGTMLSCEFPNLVFFSFRIMWLGLTYIVMGILRVLFTTTLLARWGAFPILEIYKVRLSLGKTLVHSHTTWTSQRSWGPAWRSLHLQYPQRLKLPNGLRIINFSENLIKSLGSLSSQYSHTFLHKILRVPELFISSMDLPRVL